MLFLKLVFFGVGGGIAPQPESFDEGLALVIGGEALKSGAFFVADNVSDVFVEPLLVRRLELFAKLIFLLLALLFSHRLRHGFPLRRIRGSFFVALRNSDAEKSHGTAKHKELCFHRIYRPT